MANSWILLHFVISFLLCIRFNFTSPRRDKIQVLKSWYEPNCLMVTDGYTSGSIPSGHVAQLVERSLSTCNCERSWVRFPTCPFCFFLLDPFLVSMRILMESFNREVPPLEHNAPVTDILVSEVHTHISWN